MKYVISLSDSINTSPQTAFYQLPEAWFKKHMKGFLVFIFLWMKVRIKVYYICAFCFIDLCLFSEMKDDWIWSFSMVPPIHCGCIIVIQLDEGLSWRVYTFDSGFLAMHWSSHTNMSVIHNCDQLYCAEAGVRLFCFNYSWANENGLSGIPNGILFPV